MPGVPQRDEASAGAELSAPSGPQAAKPEEPAGAVRPAASDDQQNTSRLEEAELEAALQLLVERAQYITGATGTALALPQSDEMVCRASAGSCAPSVGARLQDYHTKTQPILELFRRKELVVVVDGTPSAAEVQKDLRRQLGQRA